MTPPLISLSQTALWKNRTPSLIEFSSLLNQFPEAAVVYDRGRDLILMANSQLLKITAYTQDELLGNSLNFLLPEINRSNIIPGEEKTEMMNRHNRNPISIVGLAHFLDTETNWLLLSIVPFQHHHQNLLRKQETIFQGLLELARLTELPDMDQSFEKALLIAQSLLETNLICIYQAESGIPQLKKIASIEPASVFPETVPSLDLIKLAKLTVWIPGKRVLTEIHRAGRVENMVYVASVPLGQEGALFGLLVVGDRENQPEEQQVRMLEVLGTHISEALQHYILLDNLRRENQEQVSHIAVQNAVVENSQEGILILTPNLKIMEINPAAELMLGYAHMEVRDQPAENILIGPEGLIPALEAACRGIETRDLGNVYLHRRDGQSFPAHMRTIPVQNDEKIQAIMVFVSDQSEHEQIRIQTQQLEHRAILGDFTAVFAHEVRNPINNIVTGLQLLASKLESDDANQDMINRMQGDCVRLNHLMESVLSFSRPMEPRFEMMDVVVLLQRIVDRWRPRLARVNVNPYFQSGERIPKIWGDPRLLEQVFTNLISNAVEAMSSSGGTLGIHINLSNTVANRPHVEITVSDNGPGIPDELRERVFEPFVTNNPRGTGLGLAITKRIVTSHQGSVGLNSFPGGTMFHVYLPVGDVE